MNIDQALDNSKNGIIHLNTDGTLTAGNVDGENRNDFAPVMIQRVEALTLQPRSYRFIFRRNCSIRVSIELNNPSFDALIAARATFEPMGYGTTESLNALVEWYADKADEEPCSQ